MLKRGVKWMLATTLGDRCHIAPFFNSWWMGRFDVGVEGFLLKGAVRGVLLCGCIPGEQ